MLITRRISTGEIYAARFLDGCMLKTTVQTVLRKDLFSIQLLAVRT